MKRPSTKLAGGVLWMLALSGIGLATAGSSALGFEPPANANIVDVLSFGVVPNDGVDDTAGFQAALNATVATGRILYVPNGVYRLSDRLNWGGVGSGGFFVLQGQSREGVVLKLDDGAAGFDNPAAPRAFIDAYEGNTANQFRNYLRDVTIDIGANNPGAIGLEFQANNTGRIENVTIRSSDPQRRGVTGLNQGFNFPGPLLIRNVTIEGFDSGYVGAPQEYSAVFENLTLRNQRVQGFYVWRLPVQIRNLVSENSVPVLRSDSNPGAWGHVVIDGATLTGTGTGDAIINENSAGVLTLRNVTTTGYTNAVRDRSFSVSSPVLVPGGAVVQYTTDAPASLNASSPMIADVPVLETPDAPEIPVSQWASVKTFGAIENDNLDDTAAFRAALASGAPVVYMPSGRYYISDTLEIGAGVVRIEGLLSVLTMNGALAMEDKALFRIGPDAEPVVHINGVQASLSGPGLRGGGVWVEQASANTLVMRDGDLDGYRNTVSGGRVFLENIVGQKMVFTGQRVWARQLNPEGSEATHVVNNAGELYVLGLKTEGTATVLENTGGGRATILGGLVYPSSPISDRTRPMVINRESSLSFSMPESAYVDPNSAYAVWVRETRGGATSDFTRAMLPLGRGHSNLGGQIALYNSVISDATPATVPGDISATDVTTDSITLSWGASADPQSGVTRYNIERNGVFLRSVIGTTMTDQGLGDGLEYTYRVSAVNGAGLESPPGAAATISTARDESAPRIVAVRTGLDPRRVTVEFSERLAAASAAQTSSYAIVGPTPVTVLAATPEDDGRTVTLTLHGMTPGMQTLGVSGVTDTATAPNAVANGTRAAFAYTNAAGGTGLTGRYFAGRDFIGSPILTREDAGVNFAFGVSGPGGGVPVDNFSARWTGRIKPAFNETYRLFVRSDDGTRLYIDGVLLVGNWADQGPTERSATVTLDSSRWHDVVIEYYDNLGEAQVQFSWESASQPKQIVPAANLRPDSRLRTIRTFDGAGADTTIERNDASDNGANNSMVAFHSPASGGFHDAAYWRFDLTGLDLANNVPVDAVATLSQTFFGVGSGRRQINFFAVLQSANGDGWIESGPGFVTWDTAVGNSGFGAITDPATSRFIAPFLLDNAGFANNNQPDKASFGGPRLLEAIRADTDGRLTFIGKRTDPSNEGQSWFTKEWGLPIFAPALKVELVPRCPAFTVQPVLPTDVTRGQAITLHAEVTGLTPMIFAWRRNGEALSNGPSGSGSTFAGADSPSLTITGVQPGDVGVYELIATNACGTATSAAVSLDSVAIVACSPADIANTDGDLIPDGAVDNGDFSAFFNAFFLDPSEPAALAADIANTDGDIGPDGAVDNGDFTAFFAFFFAGCP